GDGKAQVPHDVDRLARTATGENIKHLSRAELHSPLPKNEEITQHRGGGEAYCRQEDTPGPSPLDCVQCRHPAHTATSASFEPETPLRRPTPATITGAQTIATTDNVSS